MKNGLMIAAAAAVTYLIFKKMVTAAPAAGEVVALADTSGRSIQLTEKNGYLRDQFGGLWI